MFIFDRDSSGSPSQLGQRGLRRGGVQGVEGWAGRSSELQRFQRGCSPTEVEGPQADYPSLVPQGPVIRVLFKVTYITSLGLQCLIQIR